MIGSEFSAQMQDLSSIWAIATLLNVLTRSYDYKMGKSAFVEDHDAERT